MNTIREISPGEFTLWLALFICIVLVWNWQYKE